MKQILKKTRIFFDLLRFVLKGTFTRSGVPHVQHECQDLFESLGFATHVKGSLPIGPCLILANHRSYLDVPLLAQLGPMIFVTSYEVRDEAATGFFARLGGAIFIERRNYSTLLRDVSAIKQALLAGHKVCVFPEATTTNGVSMKPWRSSLVEAAVRANVPVVPVALDYVSINGKAVAADNWDRLYYYGNMSFTPHLKGLMNLNSAVVRATVLPKVSGLNRKELTKKARQAVEDALQR